MGYVPGAWDMFHIGHLNILKRARGLCDRLIVGVVTDEALLAVKGRSPSSLSMSASPSSAAWC